MALIPSDPLPGTDTPLHRAVFLDRDGTINVEKDYLYRPEDLSFIPGAPEAIAKLNRAGYLVVVVTNQSGVARGFFTMEDVMTLHKHMQQMLLEYGARVDAFYVCPHHPDAGTGQYAGSCRCRKGQPGMLLNAATELKIDLERSYMIGDKISDIEAGKAAGCHCLLVRTGYGEAARAEAETWNIPVVADLSAAVQMIRQED
ncbi:MAG: D-glycero-beta-D-manno-heptose 1,7-bisphosphate 7-phosphatase [Pelovirga sp.]